LGRSGVRCASVTVSGRQVTTMPAGMGASVVAEAAIAASVGVWRRCQTAAL
jgi:hypothetical protein